MNIFVELGWLAILDAAVDAGVLTRIRLFQNNAVPAYTDTFADYVEADFSGYFGYTALAFGASFVNDANQGEIDSPPITWTHDGGGTSNTIYGIYVTNDADTLIYAERFPAPVVMHSLGDSIPYTPSVTVIDQ